MWTIYNNKNWDDLEQHFNWVKRMGEVPQDSRYHAEGNVAIHTKMVLEALQKQAAFQQLSKQEQELLWAAALLHDVEKYSTTVLESDGSITSYGHARKGAQFARRLLYMELQTPFELREQIVGLVRYHGLPIWLFEKPDPLKTLVKVSMEVNTEWLALLARADMLGRVCDDQEEMLYRISCFEEFCKENNCWGQARNFVSADAKIYYLQNEEAYVDYVPFEQTKFEVVVLSGLPGAGKDTFVKKNYADWPVISLDELRTERDIAPDDKKGNGQIVQEAKARARVFLRNQVSFIWNATNTTSQMRMQLIDLFLTYHASVKIIYLEVPFEKLHVQNRNREDVVPKAVLDKLANKLEVPAGWEAHQVIYHTE